MNKVRQYLMLQGYSESTANRLINEHYGDLLFAWVKDWEQERACRLVIHRTCN